MFCQNGNYAQRFWKSSVVGFEAQMLSLVQMFIELQMLRLVLLPLLRQNVARNFHFDNSQIFAYLCKNNL